MASEAMKRLYDTFAEKGYDQLLAEARERLSIIQPILKQKVGEQNAKTFLLYLVGIMVGADGALTKQELTFIQSLLGEEITRRRVEDIAAGVTTPSYMATVDKIVDSFSKSLKHHLLMFCLCFLSVDASIDKREAAYFEKLIQ